MALAGKKGALAGVAGVVAAAVMAGGRAVVWPVSTPDLSTLGRRWDVLPQPPWLGLAFLSRPYKVVAFWR